MQQVSIVILAAGASSRMGSPKALLQLGNKTFLENLLAEAIAMQGHEVMVILGADAEKILASTPGIEEKTRINREWQSGMASSINFATKKVREEHPNSAAIIFLAVDQPGIDRKLLGVLIDRWMNSGKKIVACTYAGTVGIPVLFSAKYFDSLETLTGDEGAKKIIRANPDDCEYIRFEKGSEDIDTPSQYKQYTEKR